MKRNKMLIVDDEENIRNALVRTFRKDRYDISTSDCASKAYEMIRRHIFDVIICDHKMPKITGAEFLSSIRQSFPDTFLIMLSGQADLDATIKLINDKSVDRFVPKPWDDDELRAIVNVALIERETDNSDDDNSEEKENHLMNEIEMLRLELDHPGISSVLIDHKGAIIID